MTIQTSKSGAEASPQGLQKAEGSVARSERNRQLEPLQRWLVAQFGLI
jgi:hypothetical protein